MSDPIIEELRVFKRTMPDGRVDLITMFMRVDPKNPVTRYVGHTGLARMTDTPMGPAEMSMPIDFDIPARFIEEAFEKFDELADEAQKDLKHKLDNRIILPGEMPPGGPPSSPFRG